jgi:GT2 family glycosyltransferase
VVDNASTDGSPEMVRTEFPEVKSILLSRNVGMDGYSVACRAAKGEFLFQMDNDSLMPDSTVLSGIGRAFAQVPDDVAILATRVEEFRKGNDAEELRKRDQRCGPLETLGYHSGGVAFRRSLLDRVGYYNEDVFLYGAELFVQMNVLAAGFKILLFPEILMLHRASSTARSKRAIYYETRNRYWFMRHYGTRWQQVKFLPWILLHDFYYALHKRALRQWGRAMVDGFGELPASLTPCVRCRIPLFQFALRRIASSFSPHITLRRILRRLSGGTINSSSPQPGCGSRQSLSSGTVGKTL